MKIFLAVLVVVTVASLSSAQKQQAAQTIFLNSHIYTGSKHMVGRMGISGLSEGHAMSYVQALAVSDGKIIAAGSGAEILKLKGPKTQVIDLGGHFVMPDAHVHLGSGGFEKLNVNLIRQQVA